MPSAMVSPASNDDRVTRLQRRRERRARLDLDADHLDRRPGGLHRDRHAAHEPAAADRDDDPREVVDVLQQLEPERPLARDDVGVVERVHEGHARLLGAARGRRDAVVDRPLLLHDDRAEGRGALDLGDRGLARHVDLAGDAADTGRERERLRVVARAARDDAVRRVRPERGELAQRAADLERARPLQRLRLDQDVAARALAERLGRQDRRVARDVAHRLTGGGDVLRRDGARHGAYGTATTASKPTSAPRGSDATPNA